MSNTHVNTLHGYTAPHTPWHGPCASITGQSWTDELLPGWPLHHAMHLGSDQIDQLANQSYLDIFCSIHKSWKLLALAWQCQLRKGSMVMSFKNFPIMVSCDGRSCKWRKNSIFILTYKVRDWKAQTIYTSRDLRSHWLPKLLGASILWTKVEFAFLIIQSRDESSEWGSTPKNIKNDPNDDNIRFCPTNCSVLIMVFPGWDQASEWGCFTQRQGRQARTSLWQEPKCEGEF